MQNSFLKLLDQQIVRLFVFTLEQPPARWFFFFKNQKFPPNIIFFLLLGHSLNRICRKTQESFTLRVSSVPGKPMEPRAMTTCSVYFWTYLDFTLQPLIFHKTDMIPWTRLPSKNWRRRIHSAFLVAVFHPSLALTYLYWPNTISRKLPVKATSGVHFIYPEVRVRVAVKE